MAFTEQTLAELRDEAAALEARRKKRAEDDVLDAERLSAIKLILKADSTERNSKQVPLELPVVVFPMLKRPGLKSIDFGNNDTLSFRDRVRGALLNDPGRRMTIGEVVANIQAMGYRHEGKTPLKIKVGNELYKLSHTETESVKGNGKGLYWAKGSPLTIPKTLVPLSGHQ